MLNLVASLRINIGPLAKFKAPLSKQRGDIKAGIKEASGIYVAYVLKRFDANSRGGGDWRPLKPETIATKGSSAILVDTRALRQALGASIEVVVKTEPRLTVIAKLKGRRRHRRAKMAVADLATIHHFGLGRVPQRKILIQPDRKTSSQMSAAIVRGIKKSIDKGKGRGGKGKGK